MIVDTYNYYIYELMDPRAKDLPFMSGPIPLLTLIATYLTCVYIILPAFMAARKAYSLKTIIFYYNILQIILCTILTYGVVTSGWLTHYTLGCVPVDYSDNPMALRMQSFIYFGFYVKMLELIETFFFILRKKTNQVSKLHVYHHTSSLIFAWIGVRYVAGGMATFPAVINSLIHIIMYSYYLLSSLGPEWQKVLAKWKPRITMLQMIQFCILIIHSAQLLVIDCPVPKQLLFLYLPNVFFIFYMFWNFYKKSYIQQNTHKLS